MHEVWQPESKKKPRDERGFERPVSGGPLGTEKGTPTEADAPPSSLWAS